MYQAIYRKYRPKTFADVIGQDDVTNVLTNQVRQNKIGHAYIFTGTRGTGKTSCAKIMSRAVNCLNPHEGNPCNECENCMSIINQTTMDVVEMDAASNRGIDDIRELRDQVIFPPASLKYKVYIIDEVHMLTKEGFNALLKIMEEPPSHLVFILATTEIDKIPQTILSRCQRFDFKRISREDIAKSIRLITGDMGVEIEEEAIGLIARAADGALRDAQSLLDQVLASGQGQISREVVSASIGSADGEKIFSLVDRIAKGDEPGALDMARLIIGESGGGELISSLINHFESLIIAKSSPDHLTGMDEERARDYIGQAGLLDLARLADSLEVLLQAEYKLKQSSQTLTIGLITTINLLRQVDRKSLISRIEALEAQVQALDQGRVLVQSGPSPSHRPSNPGPMPDLGDLYGGPEAPFEVEEVQGFEELPNQGGDPGDQVSESPSQVESLSPQGREFVDLKIKDEWTNMVGEIIKQRGFWGIWINDLKFESYEDGLLSLSMDAKEKTKLAQAKSNSEDLAKMIGAYLGADLKILIQETFEEEEEKEPDIKDTLLEMFGDEINFL